MFYAKENQTYNSVGSTPSVYSGSLESLANSSQDAADKVPNLISFNISMKATHFRIKERSVPKRRKSRGEEI